MDTDKDYTKITILNGEFLNNKDWFGKMDPYVKISCGPHNFKTKTNMNAGLHAVWNDEKFLIPTNDLHCDKTIVKFEAWDYDSITADDPIGYGEILLYDLEMKKEHFISLSKAGKAEGHLKINVDRVFS